MEWNQYISIDPQVLSGKPAIRGTRLAAEQILAYLAAGKTYAELIEAWPGLTEEEIRACIAYTLDAVRFERVAGFRRRMAKNTISDLGRGVRPPAPNPGGASPG